MTRSTILGAIHERVLLADGGMGTQLLEAGLQAGHAGAEWNISHPDRVRTIQSAYVDAGADILITNTFQASPLALARHGLAEKAYEINLQAARLARDCVGRAGYVLGDVGPFGGFLEPLGNTSRNELEDAFSVQIEGLMDGGVDGVVIETMTALDELAVAVIAARRCAPRLPISASVTFDRVADGGFRTMTGASVSDTVAIMTQNDVDIVGCNCGTGLHIGDYVQLVGEFRQLSDRPLMVQPNAGQPRLDHGRIVYDESPERMASEVPSLVTAGASIVGGCCGTTPQHIRLFRAELDRHRFRRSSENGNWCSQL